MGAPESPAALEETIATAWELLVERWDAMRAELPIMDVAQKTLYDGNEPIATADFFYAPRIALFVDGSPHYLDYVAAADDVKRKRLKARGYRILAIRGDQVDESLDRLARWLGHSMDSAC